MKITPLEIRQKTFEKEFRGYEKEAVDAFLQSLSQEWERMVSEMKAVEQRLLMTEKDVQKLREVESSLYQALKTAEETGANIKSQANKSAELQMKESQIKATELLNEAKVQAKNLIEGAEDAVRDINAELRDQIKQCEADFIKIETQRDNILLELKNIATDTLDRVKKYSDKKVNFDISEIIEGVGISEEKQMEVKEISEEHSAAIEKIKVDDVKDQEIEFEVNTSFSEQPNETEETDAVEENTESESENHEKPQKGSSFFDLD